jgi:hypothetical protein
LSYDWKQQLAIFNYLVDKKFPLRSLLKQPFKEQAWKDDYTAQIDAYQAELKAKGIDEVLALYEAEKEKESAALRAKLELEDKQRPHHRRASESRLRNVGRYSELVPRRGRHAVVGPRPSEGHRERVGAVQARFQSGR